ncbi:MAG: ASKHA domain-containing protein [Defluviitaleaceae bacterium]|nr:ASKHA domain-containing protein [Defluviitaleaceae bacterium]
MSNYCIQNCSLCGKCNHPQKWEITQQYPSAPHHPSAPCTLAPGEYGIALDIGTTTLAFELFGTRDNSPRKNADGAEPYDGAPVRLASYACVNAQRTLGADVITRIQRATQGDAAQLHELIHQDIRNGVAHILEETGIAAEKVRRMAIAGNTTILHLLHNLPCDTLGVHPFAPVDISQRAIKFDFLPHCEAFTLPGISTFVGADVVAGLALLNSTPANNDATFLLIDLGTNGEIALAHNGRIYASATAAGPAFEAANISCGVGSVTGAIYTATYDPAQEKFLYKTIGSTDATTDPNNIGQTSDIAPATKRIHSPPPIGICGTGVLEITAELLRHQLITPSGRLIDPWRESGIPLTDRIHLTQADLREVQTAKSAIRTGIEILLQTAHCTPHEIAHVYIAGGFGARLRPQTATALGFLPEALAHKVQSVGNTALGGAAHALLSPNATDQIQTLINCATEVNLAAHPQFNYLFMEYISY